MLEMDLSVDERTASRSATAKRLGHVVSIEGWRVTAILENGFLHKSTNGGEEINDLTAIEFGTLVKIRSLRSTVYGLVSRQWLSDPEQPLNSAQAMIEIEMIGEVSRQRSSFERGVSNYPVLGSEIRLADAQDISVVCARPETSSVVVGTIYHSSNQPAYVITDNLLGKHFAILGTSGSGKSCAVALMLRSMLDVYPNGHVVLLDPHNEYETAFDDKAELINLESLLLPYWLMNFEEAVATFVSREGSERDTEIRILRDAIVKARREYAAHHSVSGHVTVDAPIPYYLKDLQQIIDHGMGKLAKPEGATPYLRLLMRIQDLLSDDRFSFMFPDSVVKDTMAEILARVVRVPVSGKPITVVDLSGVPSEIVDVVVSMLCRMIFDFGIWSAEQHKIPILLVCEEAHRYVPRDESVGFVPTRRAIGRIAKEGRKYGVGLCLVSQRPSELSETILSQCNTIFALRLSNHHDQEFVARALPDGMAGLVGALPALHTQEAIAVGDGVSIPTRLRFRDLDNAHRPQSGTAPFSEAWREDVEGETFIHETVNRWRAQR